MGAIMMFDTQAAVDRLQSAGFSEVQAKGVSATLKEVFSVASEGLATKTDLKELENRLEIKIADLKSEIADLRGDNRAIKAEIGALKWLIGTVLIGVLAIIARLYLHAGV
ncbi:MAG: CCDC90 family protein [Helicobacteraceae bacterium]|jgi:hypothetical protein|nr:CCDC90 family protein [Helicobacteraceae bacterium]